MKTLPGEHARPLQQDLSRLSPDLARAASQAVSQGESLMGQLGSLVQQAGLPEQTASQVRAGGARREEGAAGRGTRSTERSLCATSAAAPAQLPRDAAGIPAARRSPPAPSAPSCLQLTGLAKLGMGVAATFAQTVGSPSAAEDIDALADEVGSFCGLPPGAGARRAGPPALPERATGGAAAGSGGGGGSSGGAASGSFDASI